MRRRKKPNANTMDTVIGEGTIIKGDLHTNGGLRIDGSVEGAIECKGDVTVGKTGNLNSRLVARNIFNAGIIHGSASTRGTLTITESGKMIGDINVGSLSIAQGGIFEGSSKMDGKSDQGGSVKALHDQDKPQQDHKIHKMEKTAAAK